MTKKQDIKYKEPERQDFRFLSYLSGKISYLLVP